MNGAGDEPGMGRFIGTSLQLCDLDDPGSALLRVDTTEGAVAVIVIRRGDRAFGYTNVCPHLGLPLDFRPGRFLDASCSHILCANHSALFRIDDGVCIAGPCVRARLRRAHLVIDDGWIRVCGLDPDPREI